MCTRTDERGRIRRGQTAVSFPTHFLRGTLLAAAILFCGCNDGSQTNAAGQVSGAAPGAEEPAPPTEAAMPTSTEVPRTCRSPAREEATPTATSPSATGTVTVAAPTTPAATTRAPASTATSPPMATPTPDDPAREPPSRRGDFPGCEDVAAESHYCLTLAAGAVTMLGLDSGSTCPVTTTNAPVGEGPLVSASIAWLDDDLYVCGQDGLIRISLRDGSWEVGGRPCTAVARYDGGLLVNRWLLDVTDPVGEPGSFSPLAWYPNYQAVLRDAPARTFSLGSFSETMTVQGERLYTAWHAGISVDVGDLSRDEALGVLTLEDYDGWMLGMSVTEDGYLVLSGDPWGEAVYVFDAYDGHLVKKVDAFASGLVCAAGAGVTPRETPTATPTAMQDTAAEPTPTPCDSQLACPPPCDGLESDARPFELYELPPSVPIPMNCLGGGYGSSNYAVPEDLLTPDAAEELHVIGVYEGRSNPGFRPYAEAVVDVTVHRRPKPIVLALSSAGGTLWRVALDPGARLSRVILQGYSPQRSKEFPPAFPLFTAHRRKRAVTPTGGRSETTPAAVDTSP